MDNYIWAIIIVIAILMAVVGYIADKTDFGRKEFERNPITRCPNCGANLKGNKCDYCKSKIKDVEFKISSIKKIVD